MPMPFVVSANPNPHQLDDLRLPPAAATPQRRRRASTSNALSGVSSAGSRTPPIDMPPCARSFVDRDIETQIYTHQLFEKEMYMYSLLNTAGLNVLSPEEEYFEKALTKPNADKGSNAEMFEMDL